MTLVDWTGTVGVFLILLAYFLNVTSRLKSTDQAFLWLNFAGAMLACLASMLIHYLPFVILEGTWAAVSVIAIIRNSRIKSGS